MGYIKTYTDTNTWRGLGTGGSDACAGNDSRLSDARTPTSHNHNSSYLNASSTWQERSQYGLNSSTFSRYDSNTDIQYQTGSFGWGSVNLNDTGGVPSYGSCFWDSWSNPTGEPGSGSHYVGLQTQHHNASNSSMHMMQMAWDGEQYANGDLYVRGIWGSSWGSWKKIIHSGNYSSYASPTSHNHSGTYVTHNTNSNNLIQFGSGNNTGHSASYALFQQSMAWSHPYPDLFVAYHTGVSIGGHTSYQGTRIFDDQSMGTLLFSVGDGDSHVDVTNNLYATNIYPKSNNSGLLGSDGNMWDGVWTNELNASSNGQIHIANSGGNTRLYQFTGINQDPATSNSDYQIIVNGSLYANGSHWFRSEGGTGWYNQSYGGGMYMVDSTWVRTYGSKQFYCSSGSSSAIHTAGGGDFVGQVQATRFQDRDYTGYTWIDGDYCEIGGYFTMGRRHSGTPGTFRPYNLGYMARHSAYLDVKRSEGNKDRATVRFYDGSTLKYGTGLLYAGGGVNDYYYIAYNKDTTYENNNKFYMTTSGACYSSSWSTHSDRTIKKNIEPLNMGLDVVTKMRGVTFDYIDQQEGENDGRQVGVIAQEVQESGAELAVTMGDNDTLYVDYGKIVPYLIESIKELKNEIEELKNGNN